MEKRQARKPAKKRKSFWKRGPWGIVLLMTALFFLLSIGGCSALYVAGNQMIDEKKLDLMETSTVYAADGNPIAKLSAAENREKVTFDKIPKHVVDAFIATEDNRFYDHNGIDPIGIGRAIIKDIVSGSKAEGASTITQQLARNVFLSRDKTFMRKTKEIMIALNLERRCSKPQILEMYLNVFYAGEGVFGVQTASKYYFGKDVSELSIAEGATLAALPKAPNTYSPRKNPENALKRRNLVLSLMQKNGYITQEQMEKAKKEKLKTIERPKKGTNKAYQAYVDYLVEEAEDMLGVTGDQLYQGGYQIHTYLDRNAQKAMFEEYERDRNFPKDGPRDKVQSAMVIMETKTGGITAMVGGRGYETGNWNRAKVPHPTGSTIKPLVDYAPALEKGWTPYSIVKDEKRSYGNWTPRNYGNEGYAGSITMNKALVDSRNAAAVWTLNEIGLSTGVSYLKKFGIPLAPGDENNLSIALGGMKKGASPIQMAQAYTAFANEGKMNKAHVIKSITASDGTVIVEEKKEETEVVSAQTAYYMTEMLENVVKEGTGKNARFGYPLAGKTGTQQYDSDNVSGGNRTAWFVGYTPDYVGAIYMGFDKTDDEHYLRTTGGGAPAELFSRIMRKAMEGKERKDFKRPEGVKPVEPPVSLPSINDLTATVDETGQNVKINWGGSSDNRIKYRLYRFLGSPAEKELIAETGSSGYTDAFDPSKMYTYVVVPYNAETGEEGNMSNMATITMPEPQPDTTDPNNPNQPMDPTNPSPVDPNNPNQPVDPNNPNPADPNNPNQPVDPNNPNPTDPNQQNPDQINPADPNQPASSGRGVAPPEQNDERPGRGNGRGQSGVTNP
ncbi:PBP1A family penicillin-binding protein [Aneurinibacillus danicus]|uniref:Penicillin-binding protein 1F n=2 Tax=Aneurinibacillus TaxID=55079 RepID=A0A511V7L1_9BACL|nr:PBP1A family penicillin-binding protein [Aneurinibacillus danicus]GEN34946.1 penicillin-binding protein 1F [Aneurinibacillus danicus]